MSNASVHQEPDALNVGFIMGHEGYQDKVTHVRVELDFSAQSAVAGTGWLGTAARRGVDADNVTAGISSPIACRSSLSLSLDVRKSNL